MKLPQIHLKVHFDGHHPWIFERNVKHNPKLPVGSLVEIVDKHGKIMGCGIYNRHTPVALRILTRGREKPDEKFFYKTLLKAKKLREAWLPGQKSYRLCHSEADGLSGLVIEKYADVLLIQPISAGWVYLMDTICGVLRSLYSDHHLKVVGNERHAHREKISFDILEKQWTGPDHVQIEENAILMDVRFDLGHKTGFFLDQRENRRLLAGLTVGRSLLDLCCNTGGFSISAAKAGCTDVTAVDLDEKALAVAESNAKKNEVKVDFKHANAFEFMRSAIAKRQAWDVVVLDPAKLIGHKSEMMKGKKAYEDFNYLACQVVKSGGVLLSCSCSGLLDEQRFLDIIFESAFKAKREVKVLKLTGADIDHPFTNTYPEGRYLKAAFMQVSTL